jgi:hypothetical protein
MLKGPKFYLKIKDDQKYVIRPEIRCSLISRRQKSRQPQRQE